MMLKVLKEENDEVAHLGKQTIERLDGKSYPGGLGILLRASCDKNQDKLWLNR